ncbi:MAG TPA: DUF6636 domain-containing protein [Actinomycetota bacterium]|jgi:hypothetical protein
MNLSRRVLAVIVGVTMVVTLPAASASAALRTKKFKMPSGNIGCLLARGTLRCDILSGLEPEPKRDCELDWTGLAVAADGKARPVCAGDTVMDRDARTLEYGAKWKRKGIVCRSRRSGLRCHNRKNNGFFLSRDSWDTF